MLQGTSVEITEVVPVPDMQADSSSTASGAYAGYVTLTVAAPAARRRTTHAMSVNVSVDAVPTCPAMDGPASASVFVSESATVHAVSCHAGFASPVRSWAVVIVPAPFTEVAAVLVCAFNAANVTASLRSSIVDAIAASISVDPRRVSIVSISDAGPASRRAAPQALDIVFRVLSRSSEDAAGVSESLKSQSLDAMLRSAPGWEESTVTSVAVAVREPAGDSRAPAKLPDLQAERGGGGSTGEDVPLVVGVSVGSVALLGIAVWSARRSGGCARRKHAAAKDLEEAQTETEADSDVASDKAKAKDKEGGDKGSEAREEFSSPDSDGTGKPTASLSGAETVPHSAAASQDRKSVV